MNYDDIERIRPAAGGHYETGASEGWHSDRRLRSVSPISTRDGEVVGVSVVGRDISERKRTEAARLHIALLEQSQTTHRLLLERVFETQEQERRRIARELHDQAGQLMASLLVGLRALDDSIALDEAKALARHLRAIAVQAIDGGRPTHSGPIHRSWTITACRRPPPVRGRLSKTYTIAVDLTLNELDNGRPPVGRSAGGLSIIQEALTNVARHSASTAIGIRLARSVAGLETTIADNGSGFDAASNT